MLIRQFTQSIFILTIMLLSACATLAPKFEPPTVTVNAFRALPVAGLNPQFEIDLHIINPNSRALKLQGLVYSATIEGHKIFSGVTNQLPEVAAYGDGDVTLLASADLMGGFRLLTDLMSQSRQGLKYQLNIKLDVGDFIPAIYVEEKGEISLVAK